MRFAITRSILNEKGAATGMKKGLFLYKSKYGATKRYAEMFKELCGEEASLEEEVTCDILELKDMNEADFNACDWIVFAGGIYAGGVAGLHILKKKYPGIKDKKLAVFCVGASPYDENALAQLKQRSLQGELAHIPVYYGRGAWDESRMTWKDRTLCGMLKKAVAKKDAASLEPWMKALLSVEGQKCDWTDPKYLEPLMEYIRG